MPSHKGRVTRNGSCGPGAGFRESPGCFGTIVRSRFGHTAFHLRRDTGQQPGSEMLIRLRSRRDRLILATALFASGVTGTIADPNGPVGIVMFGVAATTLLYLVATPMKMAFGRRRNRRLDRRSPQVRTQRQAVPAAHVAALSQQGRRDGCAVQLWLTADLPRPLVYVCWWSCCLLAVWLMTVGLLTALSRFRSAR